MIDKLTEFDQELFRFLNKFHAAWLDPVMVFLTSTWAWLPLYGYLLFLIFKRFKVHTWVILLGITLTLVFANEITSSLMKPYFERLRPSWSPALESVIHLVNGYKGGRFGFASSHAANTFGAATFMVLLFKSKSLPWKASLFLWPVIASYTRIYLGVHYPGDILVGGAVGALCGIFFFLCTSRALQYFDRQKNPSVSGRDL